MEMFIAGIENREIICGSREEPTDVTEWKDVEFHNDPQEVTKIKWSFMQLKGSIDAQWIPAAVVTLHLNHNDLCGSLELRSLPPSLVELLAYINGFTGSVCLTELPVGLSRLNLHTNYFSANPTKGHLSVVGWTSTPVLGEAKNLFKPLVVFLSWRRPY